MTVDLKLRGVWLKADIEGLSVESSSPYLVYTALLSQDNSTDPPVAVVLQNTLGGIVVWTYGSTGYYQATLAGAFTADKTVIFITNNGGKQTVLVTDVADNPPDGIAIYTYSNNNDGSGPSAIVAADGLLISSPIEIRVYPSIT